MGGAGRQQHCLRRGCEPKTLPRGKLRDLRPLSPLPSCCFGTLQQEESPWRVRGRAPTPSSGHLGLAQLEAWQPLPSWLPSVLGSVLLSGIPPAPPTCGCASSERDFCHPHRLDTGLCRENLGGCHAQTQAPWAGCQPTSQVLAERGVRMHGKYQGPRP